MVALVLVAPAAGAQEYTLALRPPRDNLPNVMAALDPQAELVLSAECLACRAAFDTLLDATSVVVHEIEEARRQLYRDVHLLASHYHWSEEDILALSDRKRQLYLELIEAEWHNSGRQAS